MLLVASSLKLVFEVALFALTGRWLLGVLVGGNRDRNLFYQMLHQVVTPFERLVRAISPSLVLDRHIPLATGLLLVSAWCLVLLWKASLMGLITA